MTDGEGRFEFSDLPAGSFRVDAEKAGFFSSREQAIGALQPAFDLKGEAVRDGLEVELAPWGAIEGTIFDERGDPVAYASVQTLQVRYHHGRRVLTDASTRQLVTDHRGRYRLYGLRPGQYIVSATVGELFSGELPEYGRTYYPGTTDPASALFTKIDGTEALGVDLTLSRTKTVRVSGTWLNALGRPGGGSLRLMPSGPSLLGVSAGARIQPDGAYEFVNVLPGQYVIQAAQTNMNRWTEGDFAAVPVTVGETDVSGLVIQPRSGSRITGRFTFDTAAPGHAPTRASIDLTTVPVDFLLAPPNLATAEIRSDWTFELAGITGERRLHLARVPPGWALDAIRVDGADVTDRPLAFDGRRVQHVEVVLTDRLASLAGVVTDERGNPVPGAAVVASSTDRNTWYPSSRFLRTATAGADGRFTIAGLPPGLYFASAVFRLPIDGPGAWQDPDYLDAINRGGLPISVTQGSTAAVRLRLTR
jgi:protocatechuate 3,4-dioxygenase beta subunit